MIKINLLSEGRKPIVARKSRAKLALGNPNLSAMLIGAGVALGLLIAGAWKWTKNAELERERQKVVAAQQEVNALEAILKEVESFKRQKEDLTTRITVIKELMANRRGPVNLMDGVSRALPDLVWLTSMNVTESVVELTGEAMNTNAIATFIENISQIPEFKEPDTRDVSQQAQGLYAFTIQFEFVLKKPEEPKKVEGAEAAVPSAEAPAAP